MQFIGQTNILEAGPYLNATELRHDNGSDF